MNIKKTLLALSLSPVLALALVTPSATAATVPNIKSTPQYQALQDYVQVLKSKGKDNASEAKKTSYRSKLGRKEAKAKNKAHNLYQERLVQIRQLDDKQIAQIKRIRQNRREQVASLKAGLSSQLNTIKNDEKAAVNREQSRFNNTVNPLTKEKTVLAKKLKKATNPATRNSLNQQINSIQRQINAATESKQNDMQAIQTRYNGKAENATGRYADRIQRAKEIAQRNVNQAQAQKREIRQEALSNALNKREANFVKINALSARGRGYIDAMPTPGPNPPLTTEGTNSN